MQAGPRDVAQVRLDNALALFEEFVRATVKHPDAATLRGLERRFAERLQIHPSYWSQIKSRSRQIGERLARQFEQLCHKPPGWMDQPHDAGATGSPASPDAARAAEDSPLPQDDDERFIVGLVLTYYRRHPQRARTRLLELLGEVLMQPTPAPAATGKAAPAKPPAAADDGLSLWQRSQAGIAPLKRKR
ncbi:MAG: hypothetical protein ACXWC6_13545 [Ramlibacter sp.]